MVKQANVKLRAGEKLRELRTDNSGLCWQLADRGQFKTINRSPSIESSAPVGKVQGSTGNEVCIEGGPLNAEKRKVRGAIGPADAIAIKDIGRGNRRVAPIVSLGAVGAGQKHRQRDRDDRQTLRQGREQTWHARGDPGGN